MVKAVFDNLENAKPKNHFVVGINEDVTDCSLDFDPAIPNPMDGVYQAMFYGLGSDGTVGANKNSIKIIGEATDNNAQAYFVYDSKKAGSMTTSHLRFGKKPSTRPYLIEEADFVACHNFSFLEKYDMLSQSQERRHIPAQLPLRRHEKSGTRCRPKCSSRSSTRSSSSTSSTPSSWATKSASGARINVIMQTAFFKISNIIPLETAVEKIKDAIKKSYGKAGEKVVAMNYAAVEAGLNNFSEVKVPAKATSSL